MIFVLTMSLYGLATLFTELIPKFQVGLVEFSVEYFLFIPLALAMLFDPLSAALGAATGELVFSEIMLGQFGGLGELEKFLTVTIGVYIAGRLVKDPRNRVMVGVAAITGTAAQLLMGTIVEVGGATVDRQCSSGSQAIALAAMSIMCGYGDIYVAGGMESQTLTPYQLAKNNHRS